MKACFVAGYYGMKNTGDDALQAVTCWGVAKHLQAENIYATTSISPIVPQRAIFHSIFKDPQAFKGQNRIRSYIAAFKSDGVVLGGGSVLHSSPYIAQLSHFLNLSRKGPHAAVGIGIGPFRNLEAEKQCARLLRKFAFVGLRDEESAEIAKALAPNVQSKLTFDLAPLLPMISDVAEDSSYPRKGIGFALCDFESFIGGDVTREAHRRSRILSLIEQFVSAVDEQIVFIDFNGHHLFGDHSLHAELSSKLAGRASILHLNYNAAPLQVLKSVSKLKAIVAMRLHAAVFGYLTSTPTLLLSYHSKCEAWGKQIGMDPTAIFDSLDFDMEQALQALHKALSGGLIKPSLSIEESAQRALQNWTWSHD